MQDPIQLKEKIVAIFKAKGPSIPVRIAKEINMSPLFTSAFLSELLSEKTIKTSHMKMGGTPIYLIPGQESKLEPFAEQYLKSKEKDAFLVLRKKKFLKDSEQDPAIRVALRAIRDFAIPFKRNDQIFWRYLTISENEFEEKPSKKKEKKIEKKEGRADLDNSFNSARGGRERFREEEKLNDNQARSGVGVEEDTLNVRAEEETPEQEEKQELDIFEEESKPILKSIPRNISPKYLQGAKKTPKKAHAKKHDKFFNTVKEFLSQKNIEISDIQDFNKSEITLLVKENQQEKLLIAYNKKRITETDIINAHQKASKLNLKYILISKGEPLKKISHLIQAAKNLSKIEKIE